MLRNVVGDYFSMESSAILSGLCIVFVDTGGYKFSHKEAGEFGLPADGLEGLHTTTPDEVGSTGDCKMLKLRITSVQELLLW